MILESRFDTSYCLSITCLCDVVLKLTRIKSTVLSVCVSVSKAVHDYEIELSKLACCSSSAGDRPTLGLGGVLRSDNCFPVSLGGSRCVEWS